MKKVYIDNQRGIVQVNGKRLPGLLLHSIRGAIGKLFVVKHYRGGRIVITKFPDMSGIVATEKQRVQRDLFREAVVYAKWILADEDRKKAFRKSLPRRKQQKVYQAAIQVYMSRQGDKQWLRKQLAVKSMLRAQQGDRHEAVTNGQWTMSNGQFVTESGQLQFGKGQGVKGVNQSLLGNKQLTIGNTSWATDNLQGEFMDMKIVENMRVAGSFERGKTMTRGDGQREPWGCMVAEENAELFLNCLSLEYSDL